MTEEKGINPKRRKERFFVFAECHTAATGGKRVLFLG
jgi:hypothetical protein